MKLSIESPTIQPAQTPRNGGRTTGPKQDSIHERRFQDCLADASSDADRRVANSRRTRHDAKGANDANDDDSIGDDARERGRLSDDRQPVVAPSPATPKADGAGASTSEHSTDSSNTAIDANGTAAGATTDPVVDPNSATIDLTGLDAAVLDNADAVDAAVAAAAAALTDADLATDAVVASPGSPADAPATGPTTPIAPQPALVPPAAAATVAPSNADAANSTGANSTGANSTGANSATNGSTPDPAAAPVTAPANGAHRAESAASAADAAVEDAALAQGVVAGGSPKRSTSMPSSAARSATVNGAAVSSAPHGSALSLETTAAPGTAAATTAAPLPLSPALGANSMAAQLGGPLHLDVDLGGEGLGPLRMRARTVGTELQVSLSAADAHVRATLLSHASGLRRDLETAGLEVSVNVGGSPDQQPGAGPEGGAPNFDNGGAANAGGTNHRTRRDGADASSRAITNASSTPPVRPVSSRLDLKL
jgi:flagellar hook-length control protein FliK